MANRPKTLDKQQLAVIDGRTLINQQLAADLCGVSCTTFVRWHDEENPPPRDPATGLYYVKEMGEWIRKKQVLKLGRGGNYQYAPEGWGPKEKRSVGGGEVDPLDKTLAEVRLKTAQAEKVEMENKVVAGELIRMSEVESTWQKILTKVKTKILKLPTTSAILVMGDPDLYSIQAKLETAVRDALVDLVDDWREDGDESEEDEDA